MKQSTYSVMTQKGSELFRCATKEKAEELASYVFKSFKEFAYVVEKPAVYENFR